MAKLVKAGGHVVCRNTLYVHHDTLQHEKQLWIKPVYVCFASDKTVFCDNIYWEVNDFMYLDRN